MYPTTKILAENYLKSMSDAYGLRVFALRLFNLYGPKQNYFRKHPPLIEYLIKSIIKNHKITLFASENARRDYIYITDLTNLINKMIYYLLKSDQDFFLHP